MSSRSEQDALLEQQILALSPERFEMLTFELVRILHPTAKRVAAPDGGADTILQEEENHVWQAKRYRRRVAWHRCEASLDRALEKWSPASVTFVFPFDLTQPQLLTFRERLTSRGSREKARVDMWTVSDLVGKLNEQPDLLRRFFGPSQDDLLETLALSGQAGGPIESTADIIRRLSALGVAADRQDPEFEYQLTVATPNNPPSAHPKAAVTLIMKGEQSDVWLDAIPRPGTKSGVSVRFADDEQGRQSRLTLIGALARGERCPTDLPGMVLESPTPAAVIHLREAGYVISWTESSIRSAKTVIFDIEAFEPEGRATGWRLEAQVVPPRDPCVACFAGWIGSCLVEISFRLISDEQLYVEIELDADFYDDATLNDEAAHFILALNSGGTFSLALPEHHIRHGPQECLVPSEPKELELISFRKVQYAAIKLMEQVFRKRFPIPPTLDIQAALNLLVAAELWRKGRVDEPNFAVTFSTRRSNLVTAMQRFSRAVRMPARFVICGHLIELGLAEYRYPPLSVESVNPLEGGFDPLCEVTVEATSDGAPSEVLLLKRAPRLLS